MRDGCYISECGSFGITGDLGAALEHPNAPCNTDGAVLRTGDFRQVSREEYENTVLDLRFEDAEWQQ